MTATQEEFKSYDTKPASQTALADYKALQEAFVYFNEKLWNGHLPDVIVTLQRKRNTHGYFHAQQFTTKVGDSETRHEIALNPQTMGRSDREVISTLVHEMAHLWQETFGKPSKRGYHNAEWGSEMDRIGLTPTASGSPGGKRTGHSVTHIIVDGGQYDNLFTELVLTGFKLTWAGRSASDKTKGKKDTSKTKYTCPLCNSNAWAKPNALLICGECHEHMLDMA